MRFDTLNPRVMGRASSFLFLCFTAGVLARPSYRPPPLAGAAGNGNLKTVELLVNQHPEWVAKGAEEGTRALIMAAGAGSKEVVALLLGHGVDVNGRDKYGNLPLAWAVRNSQTE